MRLLRGIAGRVLGCGCLVGVYETYGGHIIATIDALGPSCVETGHHLHEELSAAALTEAGLAQLPHPSTLGTAKGA